MCMIMDIWTITMTIIVRRQHESNKTINPKGLVGAFLLTTDILSLLLVVINIVQQKL